jgi:hypothetical protein
MSTTVRREFTCGARHLGGSKELYLAQVWKTCGIHEEELV